MALSKDQKEQIFTLLKTSDAYVNGFTRDKFAEMPVFSDDFAAGDSVAKNVSAESNQKFKSETIVSDSAASESAQTSSEMMSQESTDKTSQEHSGKMTMTKITIEELNAKILRCTRCGLARTRNNVVPGQGVEHPDVLVIGEGPGYDEDMQGLPFVGKAGALLDKMLAAINLDRKTNCYIANIVKCRPPENRDPFPDEQAACISFLEAQIHVLKPKMILCMGRIAGHKLLKIETPMNQLHGQIFDYNGIPLMVTYHPSALLRTAALKAPAWSDLKCFRKKLDEISR